MIREKQDTSVKFRGRDPQDAGNKESAKVLRMLCRTLSWLLVHAAALLSLDTCIVELPIHGCDVI